MSQVALPDFVNIEFLQKIFQDNFGKDDKVKVNSFQVNFATKKGENYASEMYRLIVEMVVNDRLEKKSIILKLMPSGIIQTIVMEKNNIYQREIKVYSEVLVEVEKLLSSIGDQSRFAPKCLYSCFKPKMLLFFEDLKESGYINIDKTLQMNYDQTLMVVKRLAKLHASSAVIYDKNPKLMDFYKEGAICANPERQDFLIFYRLNARTASQITAEWGEKYASISAKLKALEHTTNKKGCKVYLSDETTFKVFNHDDLWIPNLMFKYQEDKLEDIVFLDYQLSYFGSPGVDLNYLFYGSVQEKIRKESMKLLIREYHNELVDTLQKLNYQQKIPSLQDIHVEILKTGFHAVNAGLCLVPISMIPNSEAAEMDVFLSETEAGNNYRRKMFMNPKCTKILKKLLLEFDSVGYLD